MIDDINIDIWIYKQGTITTKQVKKRKIGTYRLIHNFKVKRPIVLSYNYYVNKQSSHTYMYI